MGFGDKSQKQKAAEKAAAEKAAAKAVKENKSWEDNDKDVMRKYFFETLPSVNFAFRILYRCILY